jgi:hypothetical protein
MNCRMAHDLLQQTLDGSPMESPEWLEHLRHCAECRALATAGRRLQDGLRLLTAPLPPPELAERIAERLLQDRRRARRRLRQRWAIGVALAASLLLALTLRLSSLVPTRSVGTPSEAMVKNPSSGARQAAPTLRESAAELGEVFAELSNETAQETVGQTRRWVSNVPNPALPMVDLATMGPSTHPLREASEGLSESLEPVATSAVRAVDLFLRELPMETETN